MSKWDKYKIHDSGITPNISRWDKYKVDLGTHTEDSWLPFLGKSVAKGVAGLGDLARSAVTAFQDPNMIDPDLIYSEEDKTPTLPTFSKEGLDYVDLQPNAGSNSLKKIAGNAAEFASSAGPLGGISKSARLIDRFKKMKDAAALGANAGVVSGGLQEAGINPLAADLAGIAAPTPATLAKAGGALARKTIGLSPANIKLDAAKAFNDLGVDVTAPIISSSGVPVFAETYLGKAPFTGSKISKKYKTINDQFQKAINETLDMQSVKRTPEIEKQISDDYKKLKTTLSEQDKIVPNNLLEVLDSIDIKSASNSPTEKAVLKVKKDLQEAFDINHNKELKKALKGVNTKISPEQIQVKELWKAKKSLNSMIKDKDFGDVRDLLKQMRTGINKDLEEFGKINPEWGKLLKDTDLTYSKLKGRDTLQNLLIDDPTNFGSESFSYNKLANNIKTPEIASKIEKAIRNDPEIFERINKLGIAASSYSNKLQRNPNPSGTAATDQIMKYLMSVTGLNFSHHPGKIAVVSTIGLLATRGLTNKKFLDAAINYAEKPSISNKMKFGKTIEDVIGLTPTALARELNREQE